MRFFKVVVELKWHPEAGRPSLPEINEDAYAVKVRL
jgi:hypothetical protein